MKFLKKVSFFKIFLIDFKAKNDDSNNFRDEDDTWRLSSSEKDTQNAPLTGNLSSDDVQNNDNNDVWGEGGNDTPDEEDEFCGGSHSTSIDEYNEDDLREDAHIFSFSFDNLMFIILFCVFLPMFIRIILFFVLLITNQKDKNIETRKQLHIFYDYELYLEFIRKYDYKLFRYHDPIFGLMDAHIRSYIRCCGVDLHRHYPNHPRVVNWRKRGYERDFEFCVNEMNDVYQEHNIIYVYNFENIKEYGFKYYNY